MQSVKAIEPKLWHCPKSQNALLQLQATGMDLSRCTKHQARMQQAYQLCADTVSSLDGAVVQEMVVAPVTAFLVLLVCMVYIEQCQVVPYSQHRSQLLGGHRAGHVCNCEVRDRTKQTKEACLKPTAHKDKHHCFCQLLAEQLILRCDSAPSSST